jgi:hypothetical protein
VRSSKRSKRKVGTSFGSPGVTIIFRHPEQNQVVTVPHPKADLPIGTLKSIERQSGLKLRGV